MHYFKRNIGDYHKKAGRLTMLQHGAYTLLLDACYDREIFPTLEEAIDWVWASTDQEIAATTFVLNKFFMLTNGVYIQHRIESELEQYHKNSATNKRIAQERETKRKNKSTVRAQSVDESPPNQEPRTINQEPLTIKDKIKSSRPDKAPSINYSEVEVIYNESLPNASNIAKLTPTRKKLVKAFFDNFDLDLDKFKNYLEYIAQNKNCQWMFESKPMNDGTGRSWAKQKFEYFISEKCFLNVKENL